MNTSSYQQFSMPDQAKQSKQFYSSFKTERSLFRSQFLNISDQSKADAYNTLLLQRLLVLYFLQKQGSLDHNADYLSHQLHRVRQKLGPDSFYRACLLPLFSRLYAGQSCSTQTYLDPGSIPHLALPLFQSHPLENGASSFNIPDQAFIRLFAFFDRYQWSLGYGSAPEARELHTHVLAYMFEQQSDQKKTGTFYTQDDVALYIASYTIIPCLLSTLARNVPSALAEDVPCWQMLQTHPDRYIRPAIRNSARLPQETEYEYYTRCTYYHQLHSQLQAGKIHTITDLTTYTLNLSLFAMDLIAGCQNPHLLLQLYTHLEQMRILDPTCGSGAFLFAALHLLQPLYTACLQSMNTLLPRYTDQQIQEQETLLGCQKIVQQSIQAPTPDYFVLHSILTKNLYGVELSPEVTDLCILRLYLFLLGSTTHIEKIQPLTDLQLHIHTGNALVGFSDEDRLINHDCLTTSTHIPIYDDTSSDVVVLKQPAAALQSTTFRWKQAFSEVFARKGFDVILGNPPYLEYTKVKHEYVIHGYEEKSCGNVYAAIIECSLALCHPDTSYIGLLVPISLCGSARFSRLRNTLLHMTNPLWIANFEIFPSRLFEDAFQRLSILIARHQHYTPERGQLYVTRTHRWYTSERPHLIQQLRYTPVQHVPMPPIFPKLSAPCQETLIQKMLRHMPGHALPSLIATHATAHFVYYQEATNYWTKAVCHIPFYKKNGVVMTPPHGRILYFENTQAAHNMMAIMNSSLFYVWFATYSDGFHLSHALVQDFPLDSMLLQHPQLYELALLLEHDVHGHTRISTRNTRQGTTNAVYKHQIELSEYHMSFSRPILNKIDHVLAQYFEFTQDELDFILNYDSKYRTAGLKGKKKDRA